MNQVWLIKYAESLMSWLQYAIDDFWSQGVGSWEFKGNLRIVSNNFLMRSYIIYEATHNGITISPYYTYAIYGNTAGLKENLV